jgi:hypothetical protein
MKKTFTSDVDIDLANRDQLLNIIDHTSASIRDKNGTRKHNTGIYVTDIPYDANNNMASIDYDVAEKRGYVKLDLLNVGIYNDVNSEEHLVELMKDPDWSMLEDPVFVENIIHINKHYDTMKKMPEPINSIPRMAMFLAVIRPGKRHLIGKTWREVAETIWEVSEEGFVFKKAHAIAYGHLVVVNMNLHAEKLRHPTDQGN